MPLLLAIPALAGVGWIAGDFLDYLTAREQASGGTDVTVVDAKAAAMLAAAAAAAYGVYRLGAR